MIIKLAFKNIMGAGLRTWLNIFILSLAYFTIIAMQGFLEGWKHDAAREIKNWYAAGGHYWQKDYDPYDPFSLEDSHAPIPGELLPEIEAGNAVPILYTPASIYPKGRMRNIVLKGIDPQQELLELPTHYLVKESEDICAIVGSRMAENTELTAGDFVTLRWRDRHGAFDAIDIKVVHVFETTVLNVDSNQMWISLTNLQKMLELPDQATIIALDSEVRPLDLTDWTFRTQDYLLQDLKNMIDAKSIGTSVMYMILLFMAGIAIFDTQILSIFRRRREMGTMMALGLTRNKIIALFTLEGILHAVLAFFVGALYGIPLLNLLQKTGISFPGDAEDYGLSGITNTLYPEYGWKLVLGTVIFVLIVVTVVSYLPVRKIAHLKPTDALRGKMTK